MVAKVAYCDMLFIINHIFVTGDFRDIFTCSQSPKRF